MIVDDDEIIAGCRKNNRQMQNLLFSHYERRVFAICMRYAASHDDARDIQQETFIKIFNALQAGTQVESLERWISRVAVNTAIDFFRRVRRLTEIFQESENEQQMAPIVLNQLHEEDLIRLIQGIPNPYRLVFNLFVIEGFSHKEIALRLEMTESTSRSCLTRAKEFIRKKMEVETKLKVHGYG